MISLFKKIDLFKIYQYLLVTLAFLMPITVAGANIIIVIICLLWLFSGNYRYKYEQIRSSKLLLASIGFFLLHVVGLIWTEDLMWGLHIVHKMWYFFLLLPILFTLVIKKNIKYYIYSFLIAIAITEILSYSVWLELIPPFKNATIANPTPFMSHISYNPILAFAIYLVLHETFFNNKLTKIEVTFYSFFSISMSINMFITGGRAGQVMFFAVLSLLIFQYFNSQKFKAIVVIFIVSSTIFLTAYQTSNMFIARVNNAISDIQDYESHKNTSLGQRISFALNSWEVIKNNPIIGVGTGDFPLEYKKINIKNTPELPNGTNPHNMYVLIQMQLGILGLISFFLIFYYQVKLSLSKKNIFIRDVGFALPILFLIIMLSDSYLLGHYTSLMFIFFSSFLYKDFEES
jgi:O-antigen ligase